MEFEFARRQRIAHIVLELAPRLHLHVHPCLEKVNAPRPALLARYSARSAFYQLSRVDAVAGPDSDSNTGTDDDLLPSTSYGSLSVVDHALCKQAASDGCLIGPLHDGKLVAAHARHGVGSPQEAAQAVRNGHQQLVAGSMSERVVDILEEVEIQQVNGDGSPPLTRPVACSSRSLNNAPIGQVRQRVVMRHMRDLGLEAPLLGDVLVRGDPTAVGHRLMHDGK